MSYYDQFETLSQADRDARLLARLKDTMSHAKRHSAHYRRTLADIESDHLEGLSDLAKLPLLRKSDLINLQEERPPLGGLQTGDSTDIARIFFSPGPISEPQIVGTNDYWRMARALHAAGFRKGDLVANCYSYHLTPAGFMFDGALREIGCTVFPGGVGATETQVAAFNRLGLTGYVGTPDFLKIILSRAESLGTPINSIKRALVSGGPLFAVLREWYNSHGIDVRECYGTAELGLIAYETDGTTPGLVIDEDCIVEIVRPGTGDPVADGEVGEVVVTSFGAAYPLIRFATGDLSAKSSQSCSSGRTNGMLKGWLGRADQTTKVRGMFVRPEQVARIVAQFPEIGRARLEVTSDEGGHDRMRLLCETSDPAGTLSDRIAEALQTESRLGGAVELVTPGKLSNDGKVIDDMRDIGV